MSSTTFFFVFIPILAIILLAVNLLFAPHNPYQEKDSVFECGFHSFLGQNRTQFSISFFIFALLFLLFDLEILLVYPYVVSAHTNGIYGLVIMLIFFLALTLGFAFELGKNALKIDSRQMVTLNNKKVSMTFISTFSLHLYLVFFIYLIYVNLINKKNMLNLYLSLPTILLAKPHAELKEIQKKIKEKDIELEECLRERALDNDLNSDQGDKDHPDEAKTAQDVEH